MRLLLGKFFILFLLCAPMLGYANTDAGAAKATAKTKASLPKIVAESRANTIPAKATVQSIIAANSNATLQPPTLNLTGYVLMDAATGTVLAEKDAHQTLAPASLTKLMTLYLVSQALAKGEIQLTDKVTVSEKAWRTPGSRMFIKVGTQVSVEELMKGVIVASGNDATVALAEHTAGSEQSFVTLMNETAAQLGMKNSHFTDSTGLPDDKLYSTPYDIALLSRALIRDFPQYYPWYKQKEFIYNNIKQPNRNRLLWRDEKVDGIKTGHTDSAGYCLASSAEHHGMRLIAVVMGAPNDKGRTEDSQALLTYGFRAFESYTLFAQDTALAQPRLYKGLSDRLPLGLAEELRVTIPKNQQANLKAKINIPAYLTAPISKGQTLGEITVTLNGETLAQRPLLALEEVPKSGFLSRLIDSISLQCKRWFSSEERNSNE